MLSNEKRRISIDKRDDEAVKSRQAREVINAVSLSSAEIQEIKLMLKLVAQPMGEALKRAEGNAARYVKYWQSEIVSGLQRRKLADVRTS